MHNYYYCVYKNDKKIIQFQLHSNSPCSSVKASSSADSTVFSVRSVTLRLLVAFIHFNHKSHEQPQLALITELL